VEVEQALAVALPDGGGEEVAEEAGPVVRLGAQGAEEVEASGSQFLSGEIYMRKRKYVR